MNPKDAIQMLATTHASEIRPEDAGEGYEDERDAAVQTLFAAVERASETGDPDQSLQDWINAGSYEVSDTVESIVAEWNALGETAPTVRGAKLTILVTEEQRRCYHIAAATAGVTLSDVVREHLDAWSAEVLGA